MGMRMTQLQAYLLQHIGSSMSPREAALNGQADTLHANTVQDMFGDIVSTHVADIATPSFASEAHEQLQAALETAQRLGLGSGVTSPAQMAIRNNPISPLPLSLPVLVQQMIAQQVHTNELLEQLIQRIPAPFPAAPSPALVAHTRQPLTGTRCCTLLDSLRARRDSRGNEASVRFQPLPWMSLSFMFACQPRLKGTANLKLCVHASRLCLEIKELKTCCTVSSWPLVVSCMHA
jgi:hypothetical protein